MLDQWANLYKRSDWWDKSVPHFFDNIYYGPGLKIRHYEGDQYISYPFPKGLTFQEWKNQTQNDEWSTLDHVPWFRDFWNHDYTLISDEMTRSLGIESVDLRYVLHRLKLS